MFLSNSDRYLTTAYLLILTDSHFYTGIHFVEHSYNMDMDTC